ncbi:MAG: tRNA (adenosine(37)-N6)-dimethylallyltransferase MiaA [Desulfuromusa sp.]|nr:tRNA (adenosine(37)-N6)-dimethylallyltransferase MiaA [Desulfuromusa sp.]
MSAIPLLIIQGATASGKTGWAIRLARHFSFEIISADSRQVYRGMDLGTGKDLHEYGDIPYHLIDIAEPGSEYNVFQFQCDCFDSIETIWQRQRLPIICGGTGMYLDAVLSGYRLVAVPPNQQLRDELELFSDNALRQKLLQLKPDQHNRTDLEQRERLVRAIEIAVGEQSAIEDLPPLPKISPRVFGIKWPREVLRKRIAVRLRQRFDAGMIDEVQQLHNAGVAWKKLEFYGLEYRLIAQYLQGQFNQNDLVQKLRSAIGQFAKRQETFFRRMEKRGIEICWLDGEGDVFEELCEIMARR